MQYTKRDLKSVDIFAMVLVGTGALFLAIGLTQFLADKPPVIVMDNDYAEAVGAYKAKTPLKTVKAPPAPIPGLRQTILGVVFLCLGVALNIGIRRVIKNKGRDIDEYGDVPAA